jgi:hypothetical protein
MSLRETADFEMRAVIVDAAIRGRHIQRRRSRKNPKLPKTIEG